MSKFGFIWGMYDGLTLENVSDRYFCKLTDQREKNL